MMMAVCLFNQIKTFFYNQELFCMMRKDDIYQDWVAQPSIKIKCLFKLN
jgi:hypothetical protein